MKKRSNLSEKEKLNSSSNRRDFLKKATVGGLGVGLLATNTSAGIFSVEGDVQSKPSTKPKIKITDLKCAIMGGSAVVRINTDAGIYGYGQAESAKPYLKPMVMFYKDYLIGEDPTNVMRIMLKIRRMGSFKPWGSAVSAIEIALWDIAGKAANLPVYKLLGGKVRDFVRPYNGGVPVPRAGTEPKDYEEWGTKVRALEQGFTIQKTAVGFHAGYVNSVPNFYYGTTNKSVSPKDVGRRGPITEYGLKYIVERVAAMKQGLGDGIGLALDCGPGMILSDAIRLANALEPFNLMWMEDTLTGD